MKITPDLVQKRRNLTDLTNVLMNQTLPMSQSYEKILKYHHSTRELPDNVLVIKFKNEKMVLSNIPAFPK